MTDTLGVGDGEKIWFFSKNGGIVGLESEI